MVTLEIRGIQVPESKVIRVLREWMGIQEYRAIPAYRELRVIREIKG